ncbi:hypothetical protein VST01_14270, partial [Escherichia coli]
SLKTSIKTITYLSDIGCLEIQGASLIGGVVVVMESIVSLTRNIVGRCISLRGDSQSASQC